MIPELVIGAGLLALGVFALRKLRQQPSETASPAETARRPLEVGDVLLIGSKEYWLAGELRLNDGEPVLSLFPSPGNEVKQSDAGVSRTFFAQLDHAARDLAVLQETSELPAGSPPKEFRHGDQRYRRMRSGRAKLETFGEHLPPGTGPVSYAVFRNAQMDPIVILDFANGDRLALGGTRVRWERVEQLPAR